jgi:sugar/nucleoside kinase (ribokinase family)
VAPRQGIIAGGNWILDHVKVVNRFPEQDCLASILSESTSNGGAAYNLLIDLAKLGFPHKLFGVGLVGLDAGGDRVLSDCKAHGIDTSGLKRTGEKSTSYTDVMTVQGTGRRTFFHYRGANALLDGSHFDFRTTAAKHFHLGYLLLLDKLDEIQDGETGAASVLKKASEAGLITSIDVVSEDGDRFATVIPPALKYTDICFMNEFEASQVTGVNLESPNKANLRDTAQILLNHGVRKWVIIHFPQGVYALGPAGEAWQGRVNLPSNQVASLVGAGDALAAGVLFALHEGKDIQTALKYGVCAAAACVMDTSTSGGILPIDDCLELGTKFQFCK